MRIPLAGAGSDHSCAGLKRKSKKKKPVFALAKKKKKPKPCSSPFVGAQLRLGFAGWVQQPGREDEAWSSNLAMNL